MEWMSDSDPDPPDGADTEESTNDWRTDAALDAATAFGPDHEEVFGSFEPAADVPVSQLDALSGACGPASVVAALSVIGVTIDTTEFATVPTGGEWGADPTEPLRGVGIEDVRTLLETRDVESLVARDVSTEQLSGYIHQGYRTLVSVDEADAWMLAPDEGDSTSIPSAADVALVVIDIQPAVVILAEVDAEGLLYEMPLEAFDSSWADAGHRALFIGRAVNLVLDESSQVSDADPPPAEPESGGVDDIARAVSFASAGAILLPIAVRNLRRRS